MESDGKTLVLASANAHKVGELQALLGKGWRCLSLADFPDVVPAREDGETFRDNAFAKAFHLATHLRSDPGRSALAALGRGPEHAWVVADDSGLEVRTLAWAPGVHSARFAGLDDSEEGGNSTDEANLSKLVRLMEAVPEGRRQARFRCVLVLIPPDGSGFEGVHGRVLVGRGGAWAYEGTCRGTLTFRPAGRGGFGYDPLFIPEGHEATFAELDAAVKNGISHRARAVHGLVQDLVAMGRDAVLEQDRAPGLHGSDGPAVLDRLDRPAAGC